MGRAPHLGSHCSAAACSTLAASSPAFQCTCSSGLNSLSAKTSAAMPSFWQAGLAPHSSTCQSERRHLMSSKVCTAACRSDRPGRSSVQAGPPTHAWVLGRMLIHTSVDHGVSRALHHRTHLQCHPKASTQRSEQRANPVLHVQPACRNAQLLQLRKAATLQAPSQCPGPLVSKAGAQQAELLQLGGGECPYRCPAGIALGVKILDGVRGRNKDKAWN